MFFPIVTLLSLVSYISCHEPENPSTDWATIHMTSEHHISIFDTASFFNLHDYSSRGSWDSDDILRTYGMMDRSASHVTAEQKQNILDTILRLYDSNRDGMVSREEFVGVFDNGSRLPDFNLGPGHHGDDEYEYEIHHFQKFHGENAKEEDLTHPEDIEHFKLHDELDRLAEEVEKRELTSGQVVEGNIPKMFLRG